MPSGSPKNGWTVTADRPCRRRSRWVVHEPLRSRPGSWSSGSAETRYRRRCRTAHSTSYRLQYSQPCPRPPDSPRLQALVDKVRPGGTLLAVYHDLDDEHREHMKSKRRVDPADYVDIADIRRLVESDFTIELDAVEPRIDPPTGAPHIADAIVRARRN